MQQEKLSSKITEILATNALESSAKDAELVNRQLVVLVLAGCKPVATITAGRMVRHGDSATARGVPASHLRDLFDRLGLAHRIDEDEYSTQAAIATDQATLADFLKPQVDSQRLGELFGYPRSAVDAFTNGTGLASDDQDYLFETLYVPPAVATFVASADHWFDEAQVLLDWADVLRGYGVPLA